MNYDHLNQVHEYWVANVFPNLKHQLAITSFDDYLKKLSFLPSCKWLHDMEEVKIIRVPFVVDPAEFSKRFQKHCVAYCCPAKPEDGVHRVVYQMSPTLHLEAAFWIWIESNKVQSYMAMFVCFKDEKELKKFFDSIWDIRRKGDTEDGEQKGFAMALDSIMKPKRA